MTLLAAIHRRRPATWVLAVLALVAQLAGVQLAAAHHARMLDAALALSEVCSANSTRTAAPASDDDLSGTHRGHSLPCSACSALALAPPSVTPLPTGDASPTLAPAPRERSPIARLAAAPPPARGPPARA